MSQAADRVSRGCLGCFGFWLVGMALFVGSLQWKFHQRAVRLDAFKAACEQVAAGLDRHAAAHGGTYPEALTDALAPGQWPRDLWLRPDAPAQPMPVAALADTDGIGFDRFEPLPGADDPGPLPDLGPGGYKLLNGMSRRPGTLLWSVSRDRRTFVLYGVGGRALSDSPDGGVELPAIRWQRDGRRKKA